MTMRWTKRSVAFNETPLEDREDIYEILDDILFGNV